MKQHTGKCAYCGNMQEVFTESQQEADRIVTESCKCDRAMTEDKKKALKVSLENLLGEESIEDGFTPVDETSRKHIESIGNLIIEGAMQSATFKLRMDTQVENGYKNKHKRRCWYTGEPGAERHEVFPGIYRQTSIKMGFQVDVCSRIHAELQANGTPWAKTENQKWRMYYQKQYEDMLLAEGLSPERARESWLILMGRNYL